MREVSTSMRATSVVLRSVVLMVSLPSSRWKWKQLMMGMVLLLESTPLSDCNCLRSCWLFTMNFILLRFYCLLFGIAKILTKS